jgi:hypothetical protein
MKQEKFLNVIIEALSRISEFHTSHRIAACQYAERNESVYRYNENIYIMRQVLQEDANLS